VTFARPFAPDGFERVLPSGIYSVESENDVLDGMFLPDCLRTSVLIHLPSTPGSPGYAQSDGISETSIRHTIPRPSKRRLSHANAEQ
jgi:hypothetical protein